MKSFFSKIMLVGPIGPKLKYLLDEKIRVPEETMIENDEIHLIAEYQVNETFSDLVAPTANRFIVSHDIFNSKMEMLDKFFDVTPTPDGNGSQISLLKKLQYYFL
jgi:ADP-dependent glucokinase